MPGYAIQRSAAGETGVPEILAFPDRNTGGNQASIDRATAVGTTVLPVPNCWGTEDRSRRWARRGLTHSPLCKALIKRMSRGTWMAQLMRSQGSGMESYIRLSG